MMTDRTDELISGLLFYIISRFNRVHFNFITDTVSQGPCQHSMRPG